MNNEPIRRRIDIAAFARAAQALTVEDTVRHFERLVQELPAELPAATLDRPVQWSVQGEWCGDAAADSQAWLHVQASTMLPLQCQRCLLPVEFTAEIDRSFRFVADEATAEAEDDDAEEDLLALSAEFDVAALVEDELLMALPLVPRHDACPTAVLLSAQDDTFVQAGADKLHPFAVLEQLRRPGSSE